MAGLLAGAPSTGSAAVAAAAADCVVLLHGMARTHRSMRPMQTALQAAGYIVVNEGYPSRKHAIEKLAPLAIEAGLEGCKQQGAKGRIHFVTHSLGGILVRHYAAKTEIPRLGRVVMLAPPNQGSAAADKWRAVPGFGWLNGPAAFQLGKGDDSLPRRLSPPSFEFAVIAGDRSIDPITSAMLDNPDDGRVSVADTRLAGMRDFRVVHATHAFMMRNRGVIALTKSFLSTGQFGQRVGSE
ncbi:MAG: alpha/beta fold hydrolase [Woeseia sp.]|nr:alpha/beta fold hydrolase [Woeseia sp.]NNL56005.1 alpha/beta fold hydrolase [Woeseia sp.]